VLLALVTLLPISAERYPYSRLKGEELYEFGYYAKALKLFSKYEEGKRHEVILDELYLHTKADAHYRMGDFDDALDCYVRVLESDSENVDYYFLKSLILRSSKSKEYSDLLAVVDSVENDSYASYSFRDTVQRYDVTPFYALNSQYSEFSPADFKNRIYFSAISDRRFTRKDVNTRLTNYDIYSVDYDAAHQMFDLDGRDYAMLNDDEQDLVDSLQQKLELRYESDLNTGFNNGPITFYNDNLAFLTTNERQKKSEYGEFNLTLNRVTLTDDVTELFNKSSRDYFGDYFSPDDVGQITFSKDKTKACMAVNLDSSLTNTDLWFADRDIDGNWGAPYPAGDVFNTDFNDLFPFWSEDDYLYFSTDGRQGSGGLDVFRVDMLDPNAQAESVGLGVNTPYDDFSFTIDNSGKGYLTSDRAGGQGEDDIYIVERKMGHVKVMLKGNPEWVDNPLFDLDEPRRQITVDSLNIKKDDPYVTLALPYGDYNLMHDLEEDSLYQLVALYDDTVDVYVTFDKILPDTLPISFTNFCFDCDGMSEINAKKFERMITLLRDFPEIEIKLAGNTDMFGSEAYNEKLGMRRANIMEKWLREAGVTNVIHKTSNGERKLVSRSDHRLNRRVDVELFWPEDTNRVDFLSDEDSRIERELAIAYDSPKDFDKPFEPGYYLLVYRANRYMNEDECAEKYGLGEHYDILLYSKESNIFNYYIKQAFNSAIEAQEFMELAKLTAKIVYLE